MTRSISLFHADHQEGYNPVILHIGTCAFFQLVGTACLALIEASTAGDEVVASRLHLNTGRDWSAFKVRQFTGHFGIIEQYAKWRNASKITETWHFGEGHELIRLVYDAMVAANNAKVRDLDEGFRKNGYRFGSDTVYYKHDLMELVRNWPDTYQFVDTIPVAKMPKDRFITKGSMVYATEKGSGKEIYGVVMDVLEGGYFNVSPMKSNEVFICHNPVSAMYEATMNGKEYS